MIEKVGWKAERHPHPQVSWINSTALDVKQRCLVLIDFELYHDKIWCDVTIDVGQIILRRPQLYDKDVTIYGRSDICRFEYEGKQTKLIPSQPVAKHPKPNVPKKSKGVNLISVTELDQKLKNGALFMILAIREVVKMPDNTIPSEVIL